MCIKSAENDEIYFQWSVKNVILDAIYTQLAKKKRESKAEKKRGKLSQIMDEMKEMRGSGMNK